MSVSIGQKAKLIQPTVSGEVIDTRFNKGKGQLEHLLNYDGADGEPQQRWFLDSELEAENV